KCCYFQCTLEAAQVQEALGPYYQVVDSSYKLTRFCDGEVVKAGCNKATGMERYLEAVGLSREDSIAFGDGPNDLEMLAYAHTGVCMGNGTDRTKAVADLVCGRVDEDGLYNAFLDLGLI
ncbi:MAG: HAD hydrolase family protein, partial [Clostridia bacterium]|nr:HAD hydrolase family protein [Clostridia bacterium]